MGSWLALLVAAWLAASISGAVGFGGALLLLPVLAHVESAKVAVPVLTLAQLLGNFSRAWFGRQEIVWKPVLWFSLGAVPASAIGAWWFVQLPTAAITRGLGAFLLVVLVLRHTRFGKRPLADVLLAPVGALVGLVSAVVGSAGPLAAAAFLGLRLPMGAYVASEAVTACIMHVTKSVVYGRCALLDWNGVLLGLLLGAAMVAGSWTGRKLIERHAERWLVLSVEVLLGLTAVLMLAGVG